MGGLLRSMLTHPHLHLGDVTAQYVLSEREGSQYGYSQVSLHLGLLAMNGQLLFSPLWPPGCLDRTLRHTGVEPSDNCRGGREAKMDRGGEGFRPMSGYSCLDSVCRRSSGNECFRST